MTVPETVEQPPPSLVKDEARRLQERPLALTLFLLSAERLSFVFPSRRRSIRKPPSERHATESADRRNHHLAQRHAGTVTALLCTG